MNDTTATATDISVCEVASGDTIVVDPRGAAVVADVLRVEQVDYSTGTLVVVYREDMGNGEVLTREWRTGFLTRVGTR